MPIVADTFTISAVILCIVGAVCFYLFTRLKQVEKKVALMEGILLDLKTATQSSFFGFPPAPAVEEGDDDDEGAEEKTEAETSFFPTLPEEEGEPLTAMEELGAEELAPTKTIAIPKFDDSVAEEAVEETKSVQTVQVNKIDETTDLESLSVAELAAIAKERGISGAGKMRKGQLISALKPAVAAEVDAINASSSLINNSSLMASPL